MEFGQRALGAKSIIACPKFQDMKDIVNSSIKYRESFRPFAPAILEKNITKIFDIKKHKSDYMEKVFYFKKFKTIYPAVVHEDGSGRVMTVNDNSSKKFKELLEYYEKKYKCEIILNTHLMLKESPL